MSQALFLIGSNLLATALAGTVVWLLCHTRVLRARPALCHGLWFLVLLKLMIPAFVPVSVLSATHTKGHDSTATASNSGDAPSGKSEPTNAVGQGVGSSGDATAPMAVTSAETIRETRKSLAGSSGSTFNPVARAAFVALLGISLLGTFALWVIALRQLQRVRSLLTGNFDGACREGRLLREVAHAFQRRDAPSLQIVNGAVTPMLWVELGTPKIVLPRQLADSLDDDQLRSILAHELGHFVRGDHWFNLFALLVTTLFWWNPTAWLARRELIASAEACCDALAVEKLAGSRKTYAKTLLAVVNYMNAAKVPRPSLSVSFGESQSLRRRFEVLANASVVSRISRLGWAVLAITCVTFAILPVRAQETELPPASSSSAATKPGSSTAPEDAGRNESEQGTKHYIKGIVFEKKTRRPIADATVNIHVEAEQVPERRGLSGITDADGRYRIEVPLGSVRLWFPRLKPGYWLEHDECIQPLVTTPDEPIVEHDIAANVGIAWPLRVIVEGGVPSGEKIIVSVTEVEDDTKRHAWLKGSPVSFQKANNSSISSLGADGGGAFTQCGESGKFVVGVGIPTGGVMTELIVDPGFDISNIKSIAPIAGSDKTILTDETGATATIGKAKVTLQNGLPLLTFSAASLAPTWSQEVIGQVLDINRNPIVAARVGAVTGVKGGGSGDTGVFATTDGEGRFALNLRLSQSTEQRQLNLVFTKDGFAGFDSRNIVLPPKASPTINAGQFTLAPGHSIAIRTLTEDGKPLPGATVEPQGDYAQRRQAIRTDSQGRGILTGLPTGAVRVFAKYGSLILQSDIVINDAINAAEETELRLHEPNPAPAAKAKSIPDPPPVGAAAPEWSISKWTDGGTRTLQSYRGKVVVLTFWSIRFKECVNAFPVVGELETKYADHDDVVFLGIHSAGTEMSEVKKLQHLENWTLLTGLDKGIDLADGATGRAYGVRGWPTTVIIDRDGKIVYNSNLEKRSAATIRQETARVVKILGLPPEKAEASTDENIDRSNKINAFRLSEHIDIAIKDTSQ